MAYEHCRTHARRLTRLSSVRSARNWTDHGSTVLVSRVGEPDAVASRTRRCRIASRRVECAPTVKETPSGRDDARQRSGDGVCVRSPARHVRRTISSLTLHLDIVTRPRDTAQSGRAAGGEHAIIGKATGSNGGHWRSPSRGNRRASSWRERPATMARGIALGLGIGACWNASQGQVCLPRLTS
jgi:hypothetical protein